MELSDKEQIEILEEANGKLSLRNAHLAGTVKNLRKKIDELEAKIFELLTQQ